MTATAPVVITDRDRLRGFFARDPGLHVYALGDLDPLFWDHTRWYALDDGAALRAVALLYTAPAVPVVYAIGDPPLADLLAAIRDQLPAHLYAHLSPGLYDALAPRYATEPRGAFRKLALVDRGALATVEPDGVIALGPGDADALIAFYAHAYPGNWFDPAMLVTGAYVGIRDGGGALIAAAGVHAFSASERVAALGNIAVAPEHRGAGLGLRVTAGLCRTVLASVDHVGLNVSADNAAAIRCYQRLGFATVAPYEEHRLTAR